MAVVGRELLHAFVWEFASWIYDIIWVLLRCWLSQILHTLNTSENHNGKPAAASYSKHHHHSDDFSNCGGGYTVLDNVSSLVLEISSYRKRISQTWKSVGLLLLICWLCFPYSPWVVELIIWNDSLGDARMNKVDTWCKTNQTSGVIKDRVEVSEERFSEDPGIVVVILEWQEALILLSDVDNVGFWNKFDIISIVNKKRHILIQVDVTWTVEQTIIIASDIGLVVEESAEDLSADGMWNLNVWVERIEESLFFWEIEGRFCTVFESRLVANSKSVNGDFPLLLIGSI